MLVSGARRVALGMVSTLVAAGLVVLPVPMSPGVARAAERPTQDPVVPGENLGGDIVYDGFTDKNLSRFGIYGIVYYLETVSKPACRTQSTGSIDRFDTSGTSNKYFLREKSEFEPTGTVTVLQPGATLQVSSTKSVTKHWSVSTSVENEAGVSWLGKIKVSVTATYGQDVTTSTTDTATVENKTSDMVQEAAYGVFHDDWAVQRIDWQLTWLPAGTLVFVGDDGHHIANWYKVDKAGCYRTGYFSTLLVPSAKGYGILRQWPKDGPRSCPHRIMGEGVQLIAPKRNAAGETVPDLASEDKKVKIGAGTCVTRSGKGPLKVGQSAYIELNKFKKNPTTGVCPVDKQLCAGFYWVSSNEISEMNVSAPPLTTWGSNDQFKVSASGKASSSLSTSAALPGQGHLGNSIVVNLGGGPPDKWRVLASGKDGYVRLQNVGGELNGYCMSYGEVAFPESCGNRDNQYFRVLFAEGSSFYLQSKADRSKCFTLSANGGGKSPFRTCKSGNKGQYWQFTKS